MNRQRQYEELMHGLRVRDCLERMLKEKEKICKIFINELKKKLQS